MPTEDPADNRAYCKAYYQRVRADPQKYAALKARKAEQQRVRRMNAKSKPVTSSPEEVLDEVRELRLEVEDVDLSIGDLFG